MLVELRVVNLVIVESAVLTPGPGLTAISGETGAGKSLLLDALDLISGARGQGQMVGRWGDSCTVSGVFEPGPVRVAAIEGATGVALSGSGGQVILRRRIAASGRSQAWINDEPVSVGALRLAAAQLIEYHGQHEPIRLADRAVQMELIDGFAGLGVVGEDYRRAYRQVEELRGRLHALENGARASLREAEFLRFQLAEFEALSPCRGELAELESISRTLASVAELLLLAEEAQAALVEDERAVIDRLGGLARKLQQACEPRLVRAGALCRDAQEIIRDAAIACGEVLDGLRPDPGRLAQVESRLDAWRLLERKHGDGEAALFAAWESLSERLRELEGLEERQGELRAQLVAALAERDEMGVRLAEGRRTAFIQLAEATHAHLADLGMPKARICLDESHLPEPTLLGVRKQEILVVANPGQEPGSIRAVASGGEMSRIMLALAAVIGGGSGIPVLVFDEVDSGVGGRLGAVIGEKLARLAVDRTVLAVTHTPQLAAVAERHYHVVKRQGDQRTDVIVSALSGAARVREIADMLGGGEEAMRQSRALLGGR